MQNVMIVTGASRGIGAATARLAARRGYAVCVNYARDHERAQGVVAEIVAQGGQAIAVQADVSREEDVTALFARTTAELGTITALVNNAGVASLSGPLVQLDTASMRRVVDVNLIGTMLCSQAAVRRMLPEAGGHGGGIVSVSSRSAQYGSANEFIHYAATKAAIETFTFGLAGEVAHAGIRVNCVSPGPIDTEIHATTGDAERVLRFATRLPMQRVGTPHEVAAAILWLLSAEASYCTGSVLAVSGGR